MTYDARERSLDEGQPIRLYEFQYGLSTWRYCTGDRNTTVNLVLWRSLPGGISDEGIRQSGDPASDALIIRAPIDLPVVPLFRGLPPATEVAVIVRDVHYGDNEARVTWIGSIAQVNRKEAQAEILCDNLLASFDRAGLALSYERNCPYATYDHNCKVDRNLFRTDATLTGITGTTIESPTFATKPDAWFAGGFIEYIDEFGLTERRFVKAHTGSTLRLLGGTPGLANNQSVSAFAGDDHTAETCATKFDNIDNNGGFHMLPGKSPFDGDLLW